MFKTLILVAVISVYDGDTFMIEAEIWPGIDVHSSVRVDGVDTPEIRGKCPAEIALAIEARERVAGLVEGGVGLTDVRHGKYAGRVVAKVILPDGRDLATVLISEGLGRAYSGGTRKGWCDE